MNVIHLDNRLRKTEQCYCLYVNNFLLRLEIFQPANSLEHFNLVDIDYNILLEQHRFWLEALLIVNLFKLFYE